MRMTKKITSVVLAVLMVVSMMSVMAVSVSATSLSDLNDVFTNGGEIALDSDLSFSGTFAIAEGKTVTLDLAGHELKSTDQVLWNKGTLSIKDSVGGGKITSTGNGAIIAGTNSTTTITASTSKNITITAQEYCVLAPNSGATVNIKGGIYNAKDNAIFMANGNAGNSGNTWNISSGTFNGTIESAGYVACGIYACNDDVWNITGGTFNITGGAGIVQRAGVVNVKGGTFNTTGDVTGKVGDSRKVVPCAALVFDSESNYPGLRANPESEMVVTGGTFNSEVDPIATVPANASDDRITVKGGTFAGDVDVSEYIDMNDITYTYTNAAGQVRYFTSNFTTSPSTGTYKLYKDATVSRITYGLYASNVTIDLNNHKLTTTSTNETYGGILMSRTGTAASPKSLTIKNGAYEGNLGIYVLADYNDLTVDNCDITVGNDFAIVTNGTKKGNNITVKDSTITSDSVAIYKPSNGTLTLKDSDVTGKTAVYVKSGDVTIDGGTFTGTGAKADFSHNGNGVNITGDAVVIENCGYPGGAPTATITDGKFVSDNAEAVASYAYGSGNEAIDEIISGGEFSSDVSDLVVASKTANKTGSDSEAPFVIENDTFVAQVGDVKYDTVSAAIDAAQAGDTVKLLKDVTTQVTVPAGKDITLDLNGNNITTSGRSIKNYGTLTIEDSVGGGKVTSTGDGTIDVASNSNTTINGGEFTAQEFGILAAVHNATITVNDGTFTTKDNAVFMANGKAGNNGNTWNINGGTFNAGIESAGYVACGIYACNDDTWNVNGGTFNVTKGAGIVQRAGDVNVADGVVINTTGNVTGKVGDSRVVVPCSALVFDAEANYPALSADSIMDVTGGTFTSEDANGAVVTLPDGDGTHVDVYGGSFSSEVPATACAAGFVPAPFDPATGKYTVQVVNNPLDISEIGTAALTDGNLFGLQNSVAEYLKGTLLGVQKKNVIPLAGYPKDETSASGQETGKDIRFVAVLDTQLLRAADDYGFVLAKVGTDKDTTNTNFDNLKANWGNGEKTVSAKGTFNNVCGETEEQLKYGDPTDTTTAYKYITCAVNGMDDSSKVVAKFYVTIGGKTYYAKYAKDNYAIEYRGITAGLSDFNV